MFAPSVSLTATVMVKLEPAVVETGTVEVKSKEAGTTLKAELKPLDKPEDVVVAWRVKLFPTLSIFTLNDAMPFVVPTGFAPRTVSVAVTGLEPKLRVMGVL